MAKSDPVKMAMNDYFSGHSDVELIVNNNYGQPDNYPIEYLFRSNYEMPEIENYAINL